MAMGSMPVPEHQVPVEEQLRILWPGAETPESPRVLKERKLKRALETRDEE